MNAHSHPQSWRTIYSFCNRAIAITSQHTRHNNITLSPRHPQSCRTTHLMTWLEVVSHQLAQPASSSFRAPSPPTSHLPPRPTASASLPTLSTVHVRPRKRAAWPSVAKSRSRSVPRRDEAVEHLLAQAPAGRSSSSRPTSGLQELRWQDCGLATCSDKGSRQSVGAAIDGASPLHSIAPITENHTSPQV